LRFLLVERVNEKLEEFLFISLLSNSIYELSKEKLVLLLLLGEELQDSLLLLTLLSLLSSF